MKYLRRGDDVDFVDTTDLAVTDTLPVGTYQLKCAEFRGFYLSKMKDFKVTERIYGDAPKVAGMIYNGFTSRSASTGALLHGYKGTGKTSLVKMIAEQAIKDGKPVIFVNEQFSGSDFNSVFGKLPDSVVVFDEFEKVYSSHEQADLLTLFDGTVNSKCLFLLTANSYAGINSHLINRPGRLLYSIEFDGLSEDVIDEYLEVNLQHPDLAAGIRKVFSVFSGTTFDMMKGLVDEVNRTGQEATELLPYLNIDIASDEYARYSGVVHRNGKVVDSSLSLDRSPLAQRYVNVWFKEAEEDEYTDFNIDMRDFKEMQGQDVVFVKDDYRIVFSPVKLKSFNYDAI